MLKDILGLYKAICVYLWNGQPFWSEQSLWSVDALCGFCRSWQQEGMWKRRVIEMKSVDVEAWVSMLGFVIVDRRWCIDSFFVFYAPSLSSPSLCATC